ncbi:SusC/RagA family TonB-linked outer membrane protein [Chishuiella sp.]|uniref:SusC/RagA family TonB-linked outer membrane protein n=1 Tax=Chishuiella sp. TaxID=1969467 RepID=UPI0028A91AA9|nr:SusC/RagA family TonB-linked outer membrane protein [Chishuiella sp.]
MKIFYSKLNRHTISVLLGLICATPLFAQKGKTITGTVKENNHSLAGVIVTEKGTYNTVQTDANGQYLLILEKNDSKLTFEQIDFSVKEEEVQNRNVINVNLLKEDGSVKLEDVIINAGYYNVKDKERTGSISRITSKEIENQPVNNFLSTMQGRMPGVEIVQDSGGAGGGFQIKIRGQNSLRSDANQPLFIIDGIPYSSDPIGGTTTSGNRPSFTSPLSSINPADIESLEVLKDADATAIYGSRGANGVVLITTKQGKSGATQVSIRTSMGLAKITRQLKLMNTQQYLDMRKTAFTNDGITTYPATAYDINGTWDQNRYTDWQKELIGGTAEFKTLQASISGGNSSFNYTISGTRNEETTVYPGDFKYLRNAVHLSLNYKDKTNKFNFLFTGNYTDQNNDQPSTDLTTVARELAPNAPRLYNEDGSLNWENNTWNNPLASLNSKFLSKINDLTTNMVISYKLLPELTFKTNLGFSQLHSRELRTFPSTMYNPSLGQGSESSIVESNQTNRNSWIIEPQLSWDKKWNQHRISVLVGTTFQNQTTDRLLLTAGDFPSNEMLLSLSTAALQLIGLDEKINYRYQAFYGRLNYTLHDRYILNITGRRDGSSRFSPQNRFSNFGAVGTAWIFSKEKLLKNNSWLSFGKLRGSYGITGSDNIGDYQYLDNYQMTSNPYGGTVGLSPIRLYNPDYRWETNKKFETALELGFFRDRLNFSVAYYQNRSGNQLVGISLPTTTGFSSFSGNLPATVENKGWEFSLSSENIRTKNWKWITEFNLTFNQNKLISFPNLESSAYANTYVIGEPTNIIKLYQFTGINPITQQYEFYDYNGDGRITTLNDRLFVADLNPSFYGGLSNQIKYKQFSLDVLFQFVKQERQLYLPTAIAGAMMNQLVDYGIPMQPYSTNNSQITANYNLMRNSNLSIVDASYIRLKNVSITYDIPLPESQLKPQIFIQAQNLFTITPYKGGDPEFRYNRFLPPLKTIVMGMKLNF